MPRSFHPISLKGPPEPEVPPPDATVNVTGTLVVMPLPANVMVPLNVPAAKPVTTGETVSVAGVVPVAAEILSHEELPALAVNVALGDAVSERLCEAGDAPPEVAENESVPGLTFRVGLVPALTVKVTGTLVVMPLPA